MRWLAQDIVHLSCADEFSEGYVSYRARPEQFRVFSPYQVNSSPVSKGAVTGPKEHGYSGLDENDEAFDTGAPETGTAGQAGRKRKRSTIASDPQRATREQEAQQRHLRIHELLLRAHSLFLQWVREQDASAAKLEQQQSGTMQDAKSDEADQSAGKDPGRLNLISLSYMKRAMKAKLSLTSGNGYTEPRNLFNQLISNDSDEDELADAAGHAVILPPRSRFMISDITSLKPLLAGGLSSTPPCSSTCDMHRNEWHS
jgi:hypothetical protein